MVKFMSALTLVGALLVSGVCAAEAAKDEKSPLEGLKDNDKVYVIGDNKTFHSAECPVIVKAKDEKKDVKELTFKQAKADELKACKRCLDKSSKDGDEPKAESKDEGGKKAEAEGGKKTGPKDEGGKKPEAEGGKKTGPKDEGGKKPEAEGKKKAKAE